MVSNIRPDFKHRPRTWRHAKDTAKPLSRGIPAWVPWCFAAGLLLITLYLTPSTNQRDQPTQNAASTARIHAIDGDTVRSNGQIFRLVGFNTPESGLNAQCTSERALAAKATDRLQQLLDKGEPNLRRVACACDPGTEGTGRCNHGRLCGKLTVDGRDVGAILIAEGLAERFECWASSCPRRKNWCRS
jgi:endonuclease YncB( thermonuclease family)